MEIFKIMLVSLLCTIVIESVIAYLLGVRSKRDFVNIILVNILTNPLVVSISFSTNILFGVEYKNIVLLILEFSALITEGFIYNKYLEHRKLNPYLISLILNFASYSIGFLINSFIW